MHYSYDPQNISTDDSGISEVTIKKPSSFGAWDVTKVYVTNTQYGGLARVTGVAPSDRKFLATPSGDEMTVRFYVESTANNNIVRSGNVKIYFTLKNTTANRNGDAFEVYADCVKHNDMGQTVKDKTLDANGIPFATTGRKKSKTATGKTLTVKTFIQPQAYAKVEYSPSPMIVGNDVASFTVKLSTEGVVNAPDISKMRIKIPSGFTVSNISPSIVNIQSIVLKTPTGDVNSNNCFVSGGYVYVFYTNSKVVGGFPGADGFDKVSFSVYGTPSIASKAYSNFIWQIEVGSSEFVSGTLWKKATTNAAFSSQSVMVSKSNAVTVSSISPDKVAIASNLAANSSTFSYIVKNQGVSGNDVKYIKIDVPRDFTNVGGLSTSNGASISFTNSQSAIFVTYAGNGLQANKSDKIGFTAKHTNTNMNSAPKNAEFKMYANNQNNKGYVLMNPEFGKTWTVTIKPPEPTAANQLTPTWIYTTAVTNTITNVIYNTSPIGVKLKYAKIVMLSNLFPKVISAQTLYMTNAANTVISNKNGSNIIYLRFYNDKNGGLLSKYQNNDFERVVIRYVDNIQHNTFAKMPTNVTIPTYVYRTAYETNATDSYAISIVDPNFGGTNNLYVFYPPVDVGYYISPNSIESSTVTNDFTFFITNRGATGNRIYGLEIPIPVDVTTNIFSPDVVPSSASVDVSSIQYNKTLGKLIIRFLATKPLDGGNYCTVTFKMADLVKQQDRVITILPTVTNNRENRQNIASVLTNKSKSISFYIPKPKGGGGVAPNVYYVNIGESSGSVITQSFTLKVTNAGSGEDSFKSVRITIPTPLSGKVKTVYSARLNKWSSNSAAIQIAAGQIELNYNASAQDIAPNQSDTITVVAAISNLNSLPSGGVWEFWADNGVRDLSQPTKTHFELTNNVIGSKRAYGTQRAEANILSDSVTTETAGNFEYEIKNGGNGSLSIKKVRIKVPSLYTVTAANVSVINYVNAAISVSGGYIWLDYTGTGLLDQNEKTILQINATKQLLTDPTNVYWTAEAYYTSNYTEVACPTKGIDRQSIVAPNTSFYSYATPNRIGKDNSSGVYLITVTNNGETGNNLYFIKIVPPTTNANPKLVITNITGVSSSLKAKVWVSNDGCVYLNFASSNTNIGYRKSATITLTAYDNQEDEGFVANWKVSAANVRGRFPDTVSLDPVEIGKSSEFKIIVPEYNSTYYVLPNQVSTVLDVNTVDAYVNNIGTGTNNIAAIRVFFSAPFTNQGLAVSTLLGQSVSIGSNYAEVVYANGRFTPLTNDRIRLTIRDGLEYGTAATKMTVSVRYNTSGTKYIDSTLSTGTNSIDFTMPDPAIAMELIPNNIYTSQKNAKLRIRLANSGQGSNKVKKIILYIPAAYTNGLALGSLVSRNAMISNKNYYKGVYTLVYSNFTTGQTNELELSVTNLQTTTGSFVFEAIASNGMKGAAAAENGDSKTLKVVKAPSAEISSATKSIYSTYISSPVTLNVNNNTSGSAAVKYIRITAPTMFTNISGVVSSLGRTQSVSPNTIVIAYTNRSGYLAKGEQDTVTFMLFDKTNMTETNGLVWKVEADNGTGYGTARESYTGALKQNLVIPKPSITNVNLTEWFIIRTSTAQETNTMRFVLKNQSLGQTLIYSNVVELPAEIGLNCIDAGSVAMSFSGAKATNMAGKLAIFYTNAGRFAPSDTNMVTLRFTNAVSAAASLSMTVSAYNGSSEGYGVAISSLQFKSPQENTLVYVYNQKTLYSIDNSDEIVYKIQNGMYDLKVMKVKMKFDTSKIHITNIYSTYLQKSIAYTISGSNIILDYTTSGGLPTKLDSSQGRDTLRFAVVFTNNQNWTNSMSAEVLYEKSLDYVSTKTVSGERDFVPVLVADFGRIKGVVLPGSANPTVKLYAHGTKTVVRDKFNALITTGANTTTGSFTLDYCPPGTYDIAYTGSGYIETLLTNVKVTANKVGTVKEMKMKRSQFSPDSTSIQTATSLDDPLTLVIVPTQTMIKGDYFALDIWVTNMPQNLIAAVNGGAIDTPTLPNNLKVVWFDLNVYNSDGTSTEVRNEQELLKDVIIKLHYSDSDILAQGWTESKLAIYYWRDIRNDWIRVGGVVDSVSNTVTAKVGYLHRYYAILGESGVAEVAPGFVNVNVDPKIFTPGSADRSFKNMKISFGFTDPVSKYEVRIYSLYGELIKQYTRDGSGSETYSQGEVYWDGTDSEGYKVKSGTYIYRVIADNKLYSGTVIIAR